MPYLTVLYCHVLHSLLVHCIDGASVLPAGELLEVSVGCGPEAQSAAVDLILGKGVVRPLTAEDEPIIRCVGRI
jgi:hypothetical protein